MKKALEFIVTSIVEKPEKVTVDEQEQSGIINFIITVDKEDMGKIIGKNGRVIKAIRNVMKIPAIKNNKKIYINLSENP
ncbi:MAG TPA: KH domain-containing protein [Patescibacteria group bacterium]|nr:KH domain-containing protein [Patescibacteria group bacterium]